MGNVTAFKPAGCGAGSILICWIRKCTRSAVGRYGTVPVELGIYQGTINEDVDEVAARLNGEHHIGLTTQRYGTPEAKVPVLTQSAVKLMQKNYLYAGLRIRIRIQIRSDPDLFGGIRKIFPGSGSVSGSGSYRYFGNLKL